MPELFDLQIEDVPETEIVSGQLSSYATTSAWCGTWKN